MRIRSIRPEFWSSEDVAGMDWHTRLVYIGLWSYVDDNGVGRDVERLILADLFPLDASLSEASVRVHGALKYLAEHGQITRYTVDGKQFLHISTFDRHQRINRPSEGRYPLPTSANAETHGVLTEPSVSPHADVPLGEGEKGRRGEGEKGESVAKATRARRLPDGWTPSPETVAAIREQHPYVDLRAEHVKFTDHFTANGKTMKDWNAAWRNWMRRSSEFTSNRRPTRQQETDDLFAAAARRMGADQPTVIQGEVA